MRVVNSQRAKTLAEKYDTPYIETSAYTGTKKSKKYPQAL